MIKVFLERHQTNYIQVLRIIDRLFLLQCDNVQRLYTNHTIHICTKIYTYTGLFKPNAPDIKCESDSKLQTSVRSQKNKYHPCEIETGFLCGDGAWAICFFARVIQQVRFWTISEKNRANVDYCYVRRRVECSFLDPELKHASLRSLTLIWPRRDVRGKHPSPAL